MGQIGNEDMLVHFGRHPKGSHVAEGAKRQTHFVSGPEWWVSYGQLRCRMLGRGRFA